MKQKFKLLFAALMLLMLSAPSWGQNVCKTLSFPDDNSANNKVSSYTESWTAIIGNDRWTIANFNNNNWNSSWSFIKAGRKTMLP